MQAKRLVKVIALLALSTFTGSAILAKPGFKQSNVSKTQTVVPLAHSHIVKVNNLTVHRNASTERLNASTEYEPQDCRYSAPAKGSCSQKARWFVLDLDLPPKKRWGHIVASYREEIVAAVTAHHKFALEVAGPDPDLLMSLLSAQQFQQEYIEEMQGIVEAIGHESVTLERVKLFNLAYETSSPIGSLAGSTVVIAKDQQGKIFHGRNQGAAPHKSLEPILVGVSLKRRGKVLADMAVVLGQVGTDAGKQRRVEDIYRAGIHEPLGDWIVSRNGRQATPHEEDSKRWLVDSIGAAQKNGQIASLALRAHLEARPATFKRAVQSLSMIHVTAPQYFILSGTNDGVVIGHNRPGIPFRKVPSFRWMSSWPYPWFMVQTSHDNGDHPQLEKCSFDRQDEAEEALNSMGPAGLNVAKLFGVLDGEAVRTSRTLFTWVASAPDSSQPVLENWFNDCGPTGILSERSADKEHVRESITKREGTEESSTKKERVKESITKKEPVDSKKDGTGSWWPSELGDIFKAEYSG